MLVAVVPIFCHLLKIFKAKGIYLENWEKKDMRLRMIIYFYPDGAESRLVDLFPSHCIHKGKVPYFYGIIEYELLDGIEEMDAFEKAVSKGDGINPDPTFC